MNKSFFSKDGLLNSKVVPDAGNEENAVLYSLQYLLFYRERRNVEYHELKNYLDLCWRGGVFHQRPISTREGDHEDLTSPDQLIAFILYSHIKNRDLPNKMVWKYLLKHFFTYNNITGKTDFKRFMQPKAILVAGYCGGGKFTRWICKPLLSIACNYSCTNPKKIGQTSGKLKAWTIATALGMTNTLKDMTATIENQFDGGWDEVFAIYFKHNYEHPILKELSKVEIIPLPTTVLSKRGI